MRLWHYLCLAITVPSCTGSDERTSEIQKPAEESWLQWHTEKQDVDMAVSEAINQPGGGDYAKGIAILRRSNWPPAVKSAQIGWLIIGSFDDPTAKRGSETLQEGLELVESAAMQLGETRGYTPQHLRMLFERGSGIAPNSITIDPVIAECWHKLENGGVGDPARCIALRRQRLPRVGR